jgi:hypothetical protein
MVYIIAKERDDDCYRFMDSVNERLFRTEREAWSRLDQIQPLFHETLVVAGN